MNKELIKARMEICRQRMFEARQLEDINFVRDLIEDCIEDLIKSIEEINNQIRD